MYKILVADDEQKIREVIKEYAEYEGHTVYEAVDGMQAVDMAKEQRTVEAVRLAKITTGTYNAAGSYKIVY